jgi:hypothetical protein
MLCQQAGKRRAIRQATQALPQGLVDVEPSLARRILDRLLQATAFGPLIVTPEVSIGPNQDLANSQTWKLAEITRVATLG